MKTDYNSFIDKHYDTIKIRVTHFGVVNQDVCSYLKSVSKLSSCLLKSVYKTVLIAFIVEEVLWPVNPNSLYRTKRAKNKERLRRDVLARFLGVLEATKSTDQLLSLAN